MLPEAFPTRILVLCDGSAPAALAIRMAGELANHTKSELHFIHVAHITRYTYPDILSDNQIARIKEEAQKRLDADVKAANSSGIDVKQSHIRVGRTDAEVLRLAEEIDAGLIVVGNRPQDAVQRILLGDDAESIVRHAHCPVLVARTDDR